MACEVKTFGKIRDFKKVQEYFGLAHDDNWLNAINCAISPNGELIALAQGEKLAFLTTCWESPGSDNSYTLSWCGELENPNQIVTSLICLTMNNNGSTDACTEWTCVAVGLVSGMVVFYSDTGVKLFSQCCQEDPVLGIKVQSPPRHSEADALFYIIYSQCICFIKGEDVFPTLNNLRQNLQRGSLERMTMQAALPIVDVIPFQKYKFKSERETILNDAAICSTQHLPSYDYIMDETIKYGYFANINFTRPQRAHIICAGAEPYLGFLYAEEGYKTLSIGEVAKDVIGVVYKNLLGNIFRRAPEPPPTPVDSTPLPTKEGPMRTRCRLYDGKRDGLTLAISPNGHLAAVTDNLDRVMLVDTQQAIILRVWKGYRDAQCAFMPVKEKSTRGIKTHKRRALFLVIYAPRLGCLDIWALQNGPKVAAFTVCKSGQLCYNTHSALSSADAKNKASMSYCLFLDPSDASLKEVHIPFHYALSETNSKTSRDIHMLRRLRNQLRSWTHTKVDDAQQLAAIGELSAELQTLEVRQQCLEMLLKSKQLQPAVFQCIINAFAQNTLDESEQFSQQIENYKRLVDFYICLKDAQNCSQDYVEQIELCDADLVTINQLVLLLDDNEHQQTAREVTFQLPIADTGEDFVDYLSVFNIETPNCVTLLDVHADKLGTVSNCLLTDFFSTGLCFAQFKTWATQACIPSMDLLKLVIYYWLDKPFKYSNCDEVVEDMSRMAAMVRAICELAGEHINDYAYSDISPWWQEVRELLLDSKQFSGLLIAIVCKTIATELWRNRKEGSCDESTQADEAECWERISHDEAQWGLLMGKLEDVAVLGAILGKPIICQQPVGPQTPYEAPDCSLKNIVNGGKGIVSDLTAKWLISTQLHPAKLVEIILTENEPAAEHDQQTETKDEVEVEPTVELEASRAAPQPTEPVLEKLNLLRAHFPFSLESGVLLSIMSWHHMVYWSKNLCSLEHMRAAMLCLAQLKAEDWALKHGMCCLIWNATLKYPLQATMKLMQKVGRLPVDKICKQDIEMSAAHVPDFLEVCLEFLEHFSSSLEHDKRSLQFEQALSDGQMPMQFIALQQNHAMPQLLKLQYEMCSVLHFIAFFQLKQPKPLTLLFDDMANKALLAEINKELTFILPSAHQVLQQQRTDFLCKVVSATMDLIREDLQQLYILDHVFHMDKICKLADSWQLNKLPILRRQVVELYAFGYDAEAQALLHDISEDEELGRLLLEIAGRRLNLYGESSQETFLKIASVGHQLLQYLDNLKESVSENSIEIAAVKPDEVNIEALAKLLTHAYKCLCRQKTVHLSILGQMYDAVRMLQD